MFWQAGARVWRLYSLAYTVMVLKAQLTFVHKENDVEYGEAASPSNSPCSIPASPSLSCPSFAGTVDPKVYTLEKVNAIAAWLLDPARCPTQWATLINIRTAHANAGA